MNNIKNVIKGTHCLLRPVNQNDDEFIVSLRNEPKLSRHISKGMVTAKEQREWIHKYIERNKAGLEYYFIVCDLFGNSCGTIRVYSVTEREATAGSWLICPGTALSITLESFLLPMTFIFNALKKDIMHIDVRKDNKSVWKWHELCGAQLVREDQILRYYNYTPYTLSIAEERVRSMF